MSKKSDDYKQEVERLTELGPGFAISALTGRNSDAFPGLKPYMDHQKQVVIPTMIRSAKRHYNGAEPWENGMVAIEETTKHMDGDLRVLQMKHFCAGVEAGAADRGVNFEKLVTSKEFEAKVLMRCIMLSGDMDLISEINNNLAGAVAAVARGINFMQTEGRETQHVWDIWNTALGSCVIAMYTVGVGLGRKWAEEEVLEGILQATSSEVGE
jgi:hypothetical protein